jgi:hypothetical protein
MKLGNLIWVLALAGAAAACNSGPAISGCTIDLTTGLCSAEGGECGPVENACTNAEDQAVYDNLVYTNEAQETFTGTEAASEIGGDCIFGSETSDPPLNGCPLDAGRVIGCFPNCPSCSDPEPPATCGQGCAAFDECGEGFTCVDGTCTDAVQAAADCVARCTQEATGLSDECVSCTGTAVACGAAFCTNVCVSDPNAQVCIDCRCANNCTQCNDICTGLPPSGECG